MSKGLGALVFVAGVAGLGIWGAKSHAVSMEHQIAEAADSVAAEHIHPLKMRVSGRDITVTGIADTEEDLEKIKQQLDGLRGRRVVNTEGITVLPRIDPFETALAKGAGGIEAVGYAPSAAARAALVAAGVPVADLPLGSGAPEGWADAVGAGATALDALEEGSFGLTGTTLTLTGIAATPVEDAAAHTALGTPEGFETVSSVEVRDLGLIDFSLEYDADTGFGLTGIVPESFGPEEIASTLGTELAIGKVSTTAAELPGLEAALGGLGGALGEVETLAVNGTNAGLSVTAEALAGVAPEGVAQALGTAMGEGVAVNVTAAAELPANGTERQNAATGVRQFAYGGSWLVLPEGLEEPTAELCAETAMNRVAETPIRFVTGSAQLDPASMQVLRDLAGILNLCTRGPGMHVTIGGHTDAQGIPERNYVLSAHRARAVKLALEALGVPSGKMIAIGYGQSRPVASNETEEGRAQNRRTTFEWPSN